MALLTDSLRVGEIELRNRVFMAPLTRGRATETYVPTPIMAEYYAQRASAGLIIAEATGVSQEGHGWPYAPGIWNNEQVEAWKPVTDAVHREGGKIVVQIWHMGRMLHSSMTGMQPVSSSPTISPDQIHTYSGKLDPEPARELTVDDIHRITDDFERAARNAITAGFDGVQIHAANGYLIDQFLRDSSNFRTDSYGGSPENRIRFLREVTGRVSAAIGSGRTSVRLSPNGESQGCIDSNPEALFTLAAKALDELEIAFLELREPGPDSLFGGTTQPKLHSQIRKAFSRPLVLNQEYTGESAAAALQNGIADAIAFGRPFIANPDLPQRLAKGLPLTSDIPENWYSRGTKGYTDYPFLPA